MNLFELYYKDKLEFKNIDLKLSNIDNALNDIEFSQNKLGKIIHVAGTNGKGTTSYFISQFLEQNNIKVALFTSPHILSINERLSINSKNISTEEFNNYFSKYKSIIKKYNLSYFEGLLLISLMWFSDNKVDVTILETGLGGTYDATNTSLIENKICVITNISQDHVDLLGKNIYNIINDKLGIIRENSLVFLGKNRDFVINYIKHYLKNEIIETHITQFAIDNYLYPYSENYCLAKNVAEYVLKKGINDVSNLKLLPCRLEKYNNITLDGSHNISGIISLIKGEHFSDNVSILLSSTKERNITRTYNLLKKVSKNIIITTIPNNDRSITHDDIKNMECEFIEDYKKAFNKISENNNDVLVTGSFYLCSAIKKLLDGQSND